MMKTKCMKIKHNVRWRNQNVGTLRGRRAQHRIRAGEGGNDKTLDNLDNLLGSQEPNKTEKVEEDAVEKEKFVEDGVFVRKAMSEEQKRKLRAEYESFGGSMNTKMGSNYFLWIIITISVFAVLSKLIGAI